MQRLATLPERLGIGSFAFRYAIGFDGFSPEKVMDGLGFILAADAFGFKRVQLCENLGFADLPFPVLKQWAHAASDRRIAVEIGMNGLTRESVLHHLRLCELFDATFLRLVLGQSHLSRKERIAHSVAVLRELAPAAEAAGVAIGVENHFDLPTGDIAAILKAVNSPVVGAVFDSTNAIGFIEKPSETLALLDPWLLSVHLKDYRIYKAEASYVMTGAVIGEGRQDVRGLVRTILDAHPHMRFILEMTVKRRDEASPGEAVEEEKQQIAASLDNLIHILSMEEPACSNSR